MQVGLRVLSSTKVHDEIITEIDEQHAEAWLPMMVEAMTFDVPGIGKPIPVSGELKSRWKEI